MVFTTYFFFIIHFWETFQDSFKMELPKKKKKKKKDFIRQKRQKAYTAFWNKFY